MKALGRIGMLLAVTSGLAQLQAQHVDGDEFGEVVDRQKFVETVLIPERLKLIDGDIVVPMDYDETRATYDVSFWPNGVVPYEFDGSVNGTNQTRMIAAMVEWEGLADVNFVPRNGENDYIRIFSDSFNASEFLGRNGGRQRVWIVSWTTHGTLVHELGHVLGFYHEQSRADRNSFVTINYNNVSQTACQDSNGNPGPCDSQFDIRTGGGEHGPYDFGSVMHYSACAFSTCGACTSGNASCRTITVLPPNDVAWQANIGQRVGASFWDGRVMSFLYPYSGWVFADDVNNGIQLGTFTLPWEGFSAGYLFTPVGGKLWLKPGNYTFTGRLERAMTIEPTYTAVRLGD